MSEDSPAANTSAIRIGLLSRHGRMPERSGLNWGQRPGRNGNEAYIALPIQYTKDGFFPSAGTPFQVQTDSGRQLTLVRRQQYGKALHSLPRNHILGLYFRERLSIPSEAAITKAHLLSYGRTDVEFLKLSAVDFYLNFGVRT